MMPGREKCCGGRQRREDVVILSYFLHRGVARVRLWNGHAEVQGGMINNGGPKEEIVSNSEGSKELKVVSNMDGWETKMRRGWEKHIESKK